MQARWLCLWLVAGLASLVLDSTAAAALPKRPNIVWIIVEDASPHIGCYGEKTIQTPHIDRLAREGVRFTQAFITCPVCSPSRSAMVSGMYQTTLGAHNHRSQRASGKGAGSDAYEASYALPESIQLTPQLFAEAGYYVVNGGNGKTDYNFLEPKGLYRGKDWAGRAKDQPFLALIELHGGKNRKAKVQPMTDPAAVKLPPYYPDHPVLRADWAQYLNAWVATDNAVGDVLAKLEQERTLDETIICFWTDHGISHARGKQFLYEEGMHVPLIVRFPDGTGAGTTRDDLALQIDVAACSLAWAGLPTPDYVQGRNLFAEGYQPRREVVAARDRCDETPDFIRAVRTPQYKYIRNFFPFVSHMQPNQYKDGKAIVQTMRELHAAGKLTEFQDRIFAPTRPPEELYDLAADPLEQHNLLLGSMDEQRATRDTANALRMRLYQWMAESADLGLIPEPVLEELGKEHGSKYGVLKSKDRVVWTILDTIEAGERKDLGALQAALAHAHPAVRWWAATGLGNAGEAAVREPLLPLLEDQYHGVRVAAAQAVCQLGAAETGLPVLVSELDCENRIVGMYAIRGLEMLGPTAAPAKEAVLAAVQSPYDGTQRIARRMTGQKAPAGRKQAEE
jgi:arylsulfatase A-like enzyme